MSLSESLEKLVDIWESKGVPMRQHVRPGLTRTEIQAALSPLGLTPPEELYELYEWHDGVDDYYKPEMLFCEHQFLPLNQAVQEYHNLLKYYSEVGFSVNLGQCFPFAFFEGDYCTLYCGTELVEGLQHLVIDIYHDMAGYCENIEKLAQTAAEWLVSGVFDSSPANEELFRDILKRLNPRVPDRDTSL